MQHCALPGAWRHPKSFASSKVEALQARSTLMEGQSTFGIQTNHVLGGIETALKQAFKAGTQHLTLASEDQ